MCSIPEMETYKICVIGGGNSGKSTFVNKLKLGTFEPIYAPTFGVEVHPIIFQDGEATICFNMWDTSGDARYEGLYKGYIIGARAAFAFYTSDNVDRTNKLVDDFMRVCPSSQIINIWNKFDLESESNINVDILIQRSRPNTYNISCLNDLQRDIGGPIKKSIKNAETGWLNNNGLMYIKFLLLFASYVTLFFCFLFPYSFVSFIH